MSINLRVGVDDAIAAVDSARMTAATRPAPAQIIRGYLVLPHAVPVIVVMSATAAFGLIAAGEWPGLGPIARLLGAMFGAQIAIGAFNELVDTDLDAVAKPEKPIPSGLVSPTGAQAVVAIGLTLMAVLSLTFGIESLLLCAMGTVNGIAYSLWFKRTIWSWVPYLIALPLLPVWVWSALDTVDAVLFAIYPIGAPAVIAVQIAQSLPDVTVDQETRVQTLAAVLGTDRARFASWSALILAASVASVLSPWLPGNPAWLWIAAAGAIALVFINGAIWRRDPRRGALAAFPCVAAGAVFLGLGWTASMA